jgi:hypothetical protein
MSASLESSFFYFPVSIDFLPLENTLNTMLPVGYSEVIGVYSDHIRTVRLENLRWIQIYSKNSKPYMNGEMEVKCELRAGKGFWNFLKTTVTGEMALDLYSSELGINSDWSLRPSIRLEDYHWTKHPVTKNIPINVRQIANFFIMPQIRNFENMANNYVHDFVGIKHYVEKLWNKGSSSFKVGTNLWAKLTPLWIGSTPFVIDKNSASTVLQFGFNLELSTVNISSVSFPPLPPYKQTTNGSGFHIVARTFISLEELNSFFKSKLVGNCLKFINIKITDLEVTYEETKDIKLIIVYEGKDIKGKFAFKINAKLLKGSILLNNISILKDGSVVETNLLEYINDVVKEFDISKEMNKLKNASDGISKYLSDGNIKIDFKIDNIWMKNLDIIPTGLLIDGVVDGSILH